MPSPFPGMDPYLEGSLWVSFHAQFAAEIARHLTPQIGSGYIALVEKHIVLDVADDVEVSDTRFRPDVSIVREPSAAVRYGSTSRIPPIRMSVPTEGTVPVYYVEIRKVGGLELVTAIEILSPANKRGEGREEYLDKRRRMLRSEVHLIEIDLLLGGKRLPMQEPYPPEPYFVLVHRASQRPAADVWPICLDQPLPIVPVPLADSDPEATLNLQEAFTGSFESTAFDRVIDYSKPPTAGLGNDDLDWLDRLLRTEGRRTS